MSIAERYSWKATSRGVPHLCPTGYNSALCGAVAHRPVTTGAPCARCMALATEALAAEA